LTAPSETSQVPRSRILAVAVAVLLPALGVPTAAGAVQTHPTVRATQLSPVSVAVAVGERYWGAEPCKGQIAFLTQRPAVATADGTADAWVTFDSSLGANDLAAPASSYTNCTMAFGGSRWPTSASMLQDWDIFCTTMIHELGHLLGHSHDSTPGSVMAPVFTDYSNVPKACRASRPRR
jgi:Matrixin